jgi:hypothetical protein
MSHKFETNSEIMFSLVHEYPSAILGNILWLLKSFTNKLIPTLNIILRRRVRSLDDDGSAPVRTVRYGRRRSPGAVRTRRDAHARGGGGGRTVCRRRGPLLPWAAGPVEWGAVAVRHWHGTASWVARTPTSP